jgi:hypothetical protein
VKKLHVMALVRDGRDIERFTAAVDLDAEPADPKIRQVLLNAVERNRGRVEDTHLYVLSIRDGSGRELHRYVDTKEG